MLPLFIIQTLAVKVSTSPYSFLHHTVYTAVGEMKDAPMYIVVPALSVKNSGLAFVS